MTIKIAGQQGFLSSTKGRTRGEMNEILPDAQRAGALHQYGTSAGRSLLSRRPSRIIAVLALASMACAGYAQDEDEDAATTGAATTTAATTTAANDADSPATGAATTGAATATAGTDAAAAAEANPDGLVSTVSSNIPIERVLGQLGDQAGVTISARGKTPGTKVTLIQPNKVPLRDALGQLVNSQANWLLYEPPDRPGTFEIWDQETYKTEVLPRLVRPKVFVPREITAEEAAKALEGVMTPGIGKVAFDPRSNKVIMTDLVPVLELAQRLLETIDVKFLTRVYYIEHADVNEVAEKLSALKSPAAPDVQVDERTRQIIVSDRIDILQKMEQLVETLDIGPDMRVYTINNLGIEGEELEELEIAIEEILTPEAYFHFNVRQGKLIVRDLPEVHDRVEKVLAAFDAPVRQIWLQIEIIETEFTEGFNWQIDYAFSGDLLGAVTDGLVSGVPSGGTTDEDGGVVEGSEGFVNFRKEFPVVQAGSTGLDATFLSRHAFVRLATAMSDSRTRVLQQPRVLVENQKLASFNVGQSVPFFTGGSIGVNQTGNGSVLTPSQPVQQLLQVGLYVEVTPIISANGIVEMEIVVENSSPLRIEQTFGGQIYTGVGKTDQTLETTMWVPSGATRVIGGLVADSESETKSVIPGLMKIPVIGPALFGSYNKSPEDNRRRNLLIFVTPSIVEEDPTDFLKYKGKVTEETLLVEAPRDAFTTPPATLTDLPTGSALSNITQLEKGDYLSYTPPPLPDFEAMSRSVSPDGQVLLAPPATYSTDTPSLSGIDATVNIEPGYNSDLDSAAPISSSGSGLTALPRVTLQEEISTDSLRSLVGVGATGPSGLLSTGSRNLVTPPAAAQGGAAKPGTPAAPAAAAAAAAAGQARSGASAGAPSRPPSPPRGATPPGRETNQR